jgi:ATP-dependent Clp protease adaptor protein ClpS
MITDDRNSKRTRMAETNSKTGQSTKTKAKERTDHRSKQLPPFNVVLLNDNDHTYDYVVEMLQSLFGHGPEQAYRLAQQVDRVGRAIVCTTHKERAELKREQISGFGTDPRVCSCKGSMSAMIEPAQG